jgi:cyclic dehypoxanthinyl futalosine synthase
VNLNMMDSGALLQKALDGQKLFPDEAIFLCAEGDLLNLAMAAREVARRLNPEGRVGYAVSKTVIYSNVCQPNCPFCTGTVTKDDPAAFTRTADEVLAEVAEAVAAGATQIALQGGHRIDLPWAYYPGLVRAIHERFPAVQIMAYSPSEIMVFNVAYQMRTAEVIAELKAAGMGALLAGGAETMNTRIPEYRALLRGPWNEWFDVVHRCADAHIPVVVPFVFGLGETPRERVGHLYRVRTVQERTAARQTPAFAAMAVFTLSLPAGQDAPAATADHVVHVEGEAVKVDPTAAAPAPVTGHEYLRMVALARVLVPTIPHLQSSVVSQGAKIAQVALDGGADDLGGTNLEFTRAELAAGRVGPMTAPEMERLIREAGREPVLRAGW